MVAQRIEYLKANAEAWEARREDQLLLTRRAWPLKEPTWGIFGIPDTVAGLLPKNLIGVEAVELGCGTAYVSAWLARRGARPVGTDPTAGRRPQIG